MFPSLALREVNWLRDSDLTLFKGLTCVRDIVLHPLKCNYNVQKCADKPVNDSQYKINGSARLTPTALQPKCE